MKILRNKFLRNKYSNQIVKTYLTPYLLLAFLFCIFSCGRDFFFASRNSEIQKTESQDHQFCVSLGLDFGDDALKTEVYWRCRTSLAKYKIKSDPTIPEDFRHNINMKELIADIRVKYAHSYEKWGDKRNSLFDNNDHKSCATQGYDIDAITDSTSSGLVEDYLICRRRLLHEQQMNPPYSKIEYFKRPQDSYSLGFALNQKVDHDSEKFAEITKKYPVCAKYYLKNAQVFKICIEDYDQYKICNQKNIKLKFERELQERLTCQKRAYVRFPDSMLLEDEREKNEIKSKKDIADFNSGLSFLSIGIDSAELEKFRSVEVAIQDPEHKKELKEKEKSDKKKEIARNFNNKNNLYSKVDIAKLRQQFIFSCQSSINYKLKDYNKKLQNSCDEIIEKWGE